MNAIQILKRVGTVCDSGRTYRLPSVAWLAQIDDALSSDDGAQPDLGVAQVVALNNLALVHFLHGDVRLARGVCRDQMALSDGAPSIGFQALVNLGRIMRSSGEHVEAIEHFASMLLAIDRGSASVANIDFSLMAPGQQDAFRGIALIEWVKSLLSAGRRNEAFDAMGSERIRVSAGAAGVLLVEMWMAELIDDGDFRAASALTTNEAWAGERHHLLVRQLYLGFLMHAIGDAQSATAALETICDSLEKGRVAPEADHRRLRLLMCALAHALGLDASNVSRRLANLVEAALRVQIDMGALSQLAGMDAERLPESLQVLSGETLAAEAVGRCSAIARASALSDRVAGWVH